MVLGIAYSEVIHTSDRSARIRNAVTVTALKSVLHFVDGVALPNILQSLG